MPQPSTLSTPEKFKIYLGSTVFFIYIIISLVVAGIIILLAKAIGCSFETRYRLANAWIYSVLWVVKACCGIQHEVEGLENLPKDQVAVVLSKHQSAWEIGRAHV